MLKKQLKKKNGIESEDDDDLSEVESAEQEEELEEGDDEQVDDSDNEEMEDASEPGPSKVRTSSEASDVENPSQKKKKKRGIIYISSIPKHMNVTILREMLSQYAKLGRVFLQPGKLPENEKERKNKKRRRRLARHFTEGWVEFTSKRAAKQVAAKLNNTPIASRKSSKFYDILWSMKYLPRFKWVHLSERLTYERAVHRQKLQTEISQARKEASFFQDNLDKSERNKKMKKKGTKAIKKVVA